MNKSIFKYTFKILVLIVSLILPENTISLSTQIKQCHISYPLNRRSVLSSLIFHTSFLIQPTVNSADTRTSTFPLPPPTDETIYQQIWDSDQNSNGIPAILPTEIKNEDKGYVIVNEAKPFTADTRIFSEVKIPERKKGTYDSFKELIDNYIIDSSTREDAFTLKEENEINDFIDKIYDTPPMKIARRYIDPNQSDTDWKTSIRQQWFQDFGFNDRSGFEHVLVGENSGGNTNVGGYHFWYKYYIDDGEGNVNGKDTIKYVRPAYDRENPEAVINDRGRKVPEIVTLKFNWEPEKKELTKPVGSFFVGCSPEGLMALGMARFKPGSKQRTTINNVEYDLIISKSNNERFIDTFFPIFKRSIRFPPPSAIRIISALINPDGPDEKGKETVTLKNTSNISVDISDWKIVDRNDGVFEFNSIAGLDTLGAGKEQIITLSGNGRNPAQLSNNPNSRSRPDGKIILKNENDMVIDEATYTSGQVRDAGEGNEVIF